MGVGRQLLDEGVSAAPVPWNGGHHDGLRRRCRLVVRRPWSRANCLRCSPRVAPCSATFVHGRGAPPRPLGLASLLLGPQVAAADGPLDLEPAAAGRVEEAGLVWAQEVVQSLGLHEDDEAEAAVVVGGVRGASGAAPLEPRVVHGGVLVEEPVQVILAHLLRNSAHEDLSTPRRRLSTAPALLEPRRGRARSRARARWRAGARRARRSAVCAHLPVRARGLQVPRRPLAEISERSVARVQESSKLAVRRAVRRIGGPRCAGGQNPERPARLRGGRLHPGSAEVLEG
mmetsp:Transcript_40038/g.118727  ORF Transcript_40038/g.118727 Transcript_40038/m.118727 type:complete len:287 (-) Transcript_40038:84-944(-)